MELLYLTVTILATVSIVSGQSRITARPWFDPIPPGKQQQATRQLVYPPLRSRPGQPFTQPGPGFPRPWVRRPLSNPTALPPAVPTPSPAQTRNPANVGYCAGQVYKTTKFMCCEGAVVQGSEQRGFECCGPEAFNRYSEICCMGTVEPAARGSKCCGAAVYHPTTEMCCLDTVVPGPEKSKQCCGMESYSNRTHGCCGGGLFNMATGMCCNGAVTSDGPAAVRECCGTNTFPRNGDHMCCDGHVVNANPRLGSQCCGVDAYNAFTDICCQDTIIARTHPGLLDQCCGAAVIGPFDSCCANRTVYDPALQQCCNGQVAEGTPPQHMCCGGLTYNIFGENRCCNDVLRHAGPDAMAMSCCGNSLYNEITGTCCGTSTIVPRPNYNCALLG